MQYPSAKNPAQMKKHIAELQRDVETLADTVQKVVKHRDELAGKALEYANENVKMQKELKETRDEVMVHLAAREELRKEWDIAMKDLRDANDTIRFLEEQARTTAILIRMVDRTSGA